MQLEQLECLCSENTFSRPMTTHTIYSYQTPSQKKDKVKLQIAHICQKVNFLIMKIFDSDTPSEVAK